MRRRKDSVTSSGHAQFLLIVPALLNGCLSVTGPADPPLLQTDALTYELVRDDSGFTVSIPYTFTNRTGGSVYLPNCRGGFWLHLEREDEGDWHAAWSPFLLLCLSPPIVIEEDEVWVDTLEVWGGLPGGNVWPRFDVADPAGTYRIVWDDALSSYQDHLPFGRPLPLAERMSNTFQLTTG